MEAHQPARRRPIHELIFQLGGFAARHFRGGRCRSPFDELLNRLTQQRHDHAAGLVQLFPSGRQLRPAKAPIGPLHPDENGPQR